MQQVKKMGSMKDILSMLPGLGIPGLNNVNLADAEIDPKATARIEAIIQSMTPAERANPSILNGPRKKRIAAGSGTQIADVNRLLKQFAETQTMVKRLSGMQKGKKGRGFLPFFQ